MGIRKSRICELSMSNEKDAGERLKAGIILNLRWPLKFAASIHSNTNEQLFARGFFQGLRQV